MNVNINFNEKSGEIDLKSEAVAEDTASVADGGAPSGDLEQPSSDLDDFDITDDSEAEVLDIGGPAEWLIQAMSQSSEEEAISDEASDEDFNDGGSGPEE